MGFEKIMLNIKGEQFIILSVKSLSELIHFYPFSFFNEKAIYFINYQYFKKYKFI